MEKCIFMYEKRVYIMNYIVLFLLYFVIVKNEN